LPREGKSGVAQHRGIFLGVGRDDGIRIVEDVDVFRLPRRRRIAVQRRSSRYVAVGVAARAYRGKYRDL
jgi:hypothetical protein